MINPMMGIGSIRFLLALVVLFLHADYVSFEAAQIAVLAFFFISGFLMQSAIQRYSSAFRFITNRVLRLLPTFLVVSLLIRAMMRFSSEEFRQSFVFIYLRPLIGYGSEDSIPLKSFLTVEWDIKVPYLGFDSELVPQAWSIGNEMIYYLTVPLLALLGTRKIIALVAGSGIFLLVQLFMKWEKFDYLVYTNLLATYFLFGAGYLVSQFASAEPWFHGKSLALIRILTIALLVTLFWIDFPDSISPFLTILSALGLVTAISFGYLRMERASEGEISRFLGKLSYPLYLSHMIAIGVLNYLGVLSPLLLILASLILSMILYFLIERPIEVWRTRLRA
jgi:peptidoglycan/LPS O-acetylase OafA/YrhL